MIRSGNILIHHFKFSPAGGNFKRFRTSSVANDALTLKRVNILYMCRAPQLGKNSKDSKPLLILYATCIKIVIYL